MKFKVVLVAALAGVGLVGLARAQQPDKDAPTVNNVRFGDPTSIARKYQDFLPGVIKDLKPDALVLTSTKFGTDQSFKITKKTKFILDGRPSTFDKLKAGDRVFVDVDHDRRSGKLIARKVISGVDIPSVP